MLTESGVSTVVRKTHRAEGKKGGGVAADRLTSLPARIETLAYQTSFDLTRQSGSVPISVSIFPADRFRPAMDIMRHVFKSSLCFSDLVAVTSEGERLGTVAVPRGKVGLATVSNILVKAVLLKAGIPADARFEGILQIKNRRPMRFVDLIEYSGVSLDPAEIFIAGRMTSVNNAVRGGGGKILASFWDIPALCRADVESTLDRLKLWGVRGSIVLGRVSEPLCEMPVAAYRVGMILPDGLNPVAAAVEMGIETEIHPIGGLINASELRSVVNLSKDIRR